MGQRVQRKIGKSSFTGVKRWEEFQVVINLAKAAEFRL